MEKDINNPDKEIELSVIVPCYNEENNVQELTDRIRIVFLDKGISGEIILVDDKSTDNTKKKIIEQVGKYPDGVQGVFHDKNYGMEKGWKSGLARVRGNLVCIIDADLQYLPEDIYRLYREYHYTGVDYVQGYRSTIGREKGNRYYFSVGLNVLLNFTFGMKARDNKSGFILTSKQIFNNILFHRFDYSYFQSFISVSAHSKGYSMSEVEVIFDKRRTGDSFLNNFPLSTILKTFNDIAKAFFEFRFSSKKDIFLDEYIDSYQNKIEDKSLKFSAARRLYLKFYALLMPLHHWMIGATAIHYFWLLRKTQWLKPEQVLDLQYKRLTMLLEHAYRHVPYYRDVFNSLNLTPKDIRSIDDLQKLPLLDKPTMRKHIYFDLFSDNHNKRDISRISTSGSTGEPFICYVDKNQLEMRWASTLRSQEWTGYKFGDRCVRLWHQTIGMSKTQVFKEFFDALLSRRKFIPAYSVDKYTIKDFVRSLTKHKPTLIDGYAESFNFLASYLKHESLPKNNLQGVMSSAQTLSKQSRDIIEGTFGTPVFDKYGSREFSGIAYECEAHQGHHIVAESYIVEIIKDGRKALPGEIGEVVVTDLNNYCMPFVRYRVGDLAIATDAVCLCGRGLPLLGDIQGRTQSIIFAANNQYVPGSLFPHLFKDYDYAIKQFQVEQLKKGEIILRIVKAGRFTEGILAELLAELRVYLGASMKIDVEYVDNIPLGRTGKYQHSISRLNVNFQNFEKDDIALSKQHGK